MAIDVFKRYEIKFLITREQYGFLSQLMYDRMRLDEYNEGGRLYGIYNLYYDTPDNQLISASIKKDSKYRHKIRLRSYDTSLPTAFLEIKKKVLGIVSKRRSLMYIDEVNPFLMAHVMPKIKPIHNVQILHELDALARTMELMPKLLLCYDREALFAKDVEDGDLRVTFDFNIRSRRDNLDLRLGGDGTRLIEEDLILMEVKVADSVPMWLARAMSEAGARKRSFSKYGTEYAEYVLNNYMEVTHV